MYSCTLKCIPWRPKHKKKPKNSLKPLQNLHHNNDIILTNIIWPNFNMNYFGPKDHCSFHRCNLSGVIYVAKITREMWDPSDQLKDFIKMGNVNNHMVTKKNMYLHGNIYFLMWKLPIIQGDCWDWNTLMAIDKMVCYRRGKQTTEIHFTRWILQHLTKTKQHKNFSGINTNPTKTSRATSY